MDKDIIEKEFMNVYHKVFRDLESIIKDVNYANIDGIINDEDRKYYIDNLWEIKIHLLILKKVLMFFSF